MRRFPLALLLIASTGSCSECDPITPPPSCTAPAAGRFRPADASQAVTDLRTARANLPLPAPTGAALRSECRRVFQDLIETTHCSADVDAYCDASCPSPAARTSCRTGLRREPAMDRCRADALPVFVREYPICDGFILCGNDLEPAGTTCPRQG